MLYLQQLGTSYYLRDTDGWTVSLTYPQYQTLLDLDAGVITEEEIASRVKHYEVLQEEVLCPICGKGTLPRGVILLLMQDSSLHENIVHKEQ